MFLIYLISQIGFRSFHKATASFFPPPPLSFQMDFILNYFDLFVTCSHLKSQRGKVGAGLRLHLGSLWRDRNWLAKRTRNQKKGKKRLK